MYKIYADDTLIYDSTIDDYKIGKGEVTLEINRSGSFVFSIYPDHFYYDRFVRLKTVITVYKSDKIVFRGRILNDVTDYWNNKVITCEGELGFLQDSIIRPFSFNGTPKNLFKKFVEEHNSQVDEFKRFKIGKVTVEDPNNYIARDNSNYESAFDNLNSRLIEDSLGGYFYITHGNDGTDPVPTLNYYADFDKVSSQVVEFGSNLQDYTKTVSAEEIATAIIPLGAEVDDGNDETENAKLTIASVNNGRDYVYSAAGVALYGWIFKVVEWDDVSVAANLKSRAEEYIEDVVNQSITIELTAIDLHLLDRSIESFALCDYIRVRSEPHNFDMTLLCNKQTLNLLKPDSDKIVLGRTYTTFTERTSKMSTVISSVSDVKRGLTRVSSSVANVATDVNNITGVENEEYPGCYYRATAEEIEWINPPLIADVEYRTAERFGAKVVYVKRVDFGALPNNGTKTINIGIKPGNIVNIEAHTVSDNYYYPLPGGSAGALASYYYIDSAGALGVRTTTDLTNQKAFFTVKYTKD